MTDRRINADLRELNDRLEAAIARSRSTIAADRRLADRPFEGEDRRLFPEVDVTFRGLDVEPREYTDPMFPGLWKAAIPGALFDLALVAWVLWS